MDVVAVAEAANDVAVTEARNDIVAITEASHSVAVVDETNNMIRSSPERTSPMERLYTESIDKVAETPVEISNIISVSNTNEMNVVIAEITPTDNLNLQASPLSIKESVPSTSVKIISQIDDWVPDNDSTISNVQITSSPPLSQELPTEKLAIKTNVETSSVSMDIEYEPKLIDDDIVAKSPQQLSKSQDEISTNEINFPSANIELKCTGFSKETYPILPDTGTYRERLKSESDIALMETDDTYKPPAGSMNDLVVLPDVITTSVALKIKNESVCSSQHEDLPTEITYSTEETSDQRDGKAIEQLTVTSPTSTNKGSSVSNESPISPIVESQSLTQLKESILSPINFVNDKNAPETIAPVQTLPPIFSSPIKLFTNSTPTTTTSMISPNYGNVSESMPANILSSPSQLIDNPQQPTINGCGGFISMSGSGTSIHYTTENNNFFEDDNNTNCSSSTTDSEELVIDCPVNKAKNKPIMNVNGDCELQQQTSDTLIGIGSQINFNVNEAGAKGSRRKQNRPAVNRNVIRNSDKRVRKRKSADVPADNVHQIKQLKFNETKVNTASSNVHVSDTLPEQFRHTGNNNKLLLSTSNQQSIPHMTEEMKHFVKYQLQYSDLDKVFGIGQQNSYSQYWGLQPAVKFKCFKCFDSRYKSLAELKEHQRICLRQSIDNKDNTLFENNPQPVHTILKPHNAMEMPENVFDIPTNCENNSTKVCTAKPLQATSDTKIRITRKVFLCRSCGTYYEKWNLFIHLREVHKKFICLFCLGIFPSAERLVYHLEGKHSQSPHIYERKEELIKAVQQQYYLMCCVCEHVFTEHDDFTSHSCENYIQPCSLCGLKFIHKANCKAAVTNSGKQAGRQKDPNFVKSKPTNGKNRKARNADTNLQQSNEMGNFEQNNSETSTFVNGHHVGVDLVNNAIKNNIVNLNSELLRLIGKTSHPSSILSDQHHRTQLPPPKRQSINLTDPQSDESIILNSLKMNGDNNLNALNKGTPIDMNGIYDKSIEESIKPIVEKTEPEKQLLVPKLKLKISREFQTPIESEESSTESDSNGEEDDEDDNDEEVDVQEQEEQPNRPIDKLDVFGAQQIEFEKLDTIDQKLDIQKESANLENESNMRLSVKSFDSDMDIEEIMPPTYIEKPEEQPAASLTTIDDTKSLEKPASEDDIAVAGDEIQIHDIQLDQPLDKIPLKDFIRTCLRASYPFCLYCNHARIIAVNGTSLARHMITHHKFSAIVNSITAEELLPPTIVGRLKSSLAELESAYFNLENYDNESEMSTMPQQHVLFECFQCRFQTFVHKELYVHNRKMHLKAMLMCLMCRSNFFSYSELLCHLCPGAANKVVMFNTMYRCALCNVSNLPSAFRLMVHLRKKHSACDVCLEVCYDQNKLSMHVWKHKLHHLCYRCNIAYRNKPDINKHLFWKHGTESVICKHCLLKKWPHVYHFCVPPTTFVCDVCNLQFRRAVSLKVHSRIHSDEDAPYPCTEDNCDKKFISRKLLLKHVHRHSIQPIIEESKPIITEQPVSFVQPVKPDLKTESIDVKLDQVKKETKHPVGETTTSHKRVKKLKKSKQLTSPEKQKNLLEMMDLPAPNLSESDSSDESDVERNIVPKLFDTNQPIESTGKDDDVDDTDDDNNQQSIVPIMDIWDNFKSYQAEKLQNQQQSDDEVDYIPQRPALLHVAQSDHDYCHIYKRRSKLVKSRIKDDSGKPTTLDEILSMEPTTTTEETEKVKEPTIAHSGGKPSKKTPVKSNKSDSSDSESSGSGSSCSCGSNCSCSTSSSGTSSSSSGSEDSDSSSSESRLRKQKRKERKQDKRDRLKSETSIKTNASDHIDVVTMTDIKPHITDPDSIIHESDLETDESETDEDFYDDHPQRLASEMLAEKRRQLMQSCTTPLNSFDIVENSRPSTPSLPGDVAKEKKVRVKKRKKDRKNSARNVPSLKINLSTMQQIPPATDLNEVIKAPTNNLVQQSDTQHYTVPPLAIPYKLTSNGGYVVPNKPQNPTVAPGTLKSIQHFNRHRLSTGSSCSDADAPLKRSKRRRIPNKFYGYTSDEDYSNSSINYPTPTIAFKPGPPPDLTWDKEDLPQIPTIQRKNSTCTVTSLKIRLPNAKKSAKKSKPTVPPVIEQGTASYISSMPMSKPLKKPVRPRKITTPTVVPITKQQPTPPIVPPLIIRPPKISSILRVPDVPPHHLMPTGSDHDDSDERSNDSSDEANSTDKETSEQTEFDSIMNTTPKIPQHLLQPLVPKQLDTNSPVLLKPPELPAPVQIQTTPNIIPSMSQSQPQLLQQQSHLLPSNPVGFPYVQPPASYRPAREGESVYCYCRCPYDEISEMIACDGDNCPIEWFHFECVGIMVPPKGKWYCPQCKPQYQHLIDLAAAINNDDESGKTSNNVNNF